ITPRTRMRVSSIQAGSLKLCTCSASSSWRLVASTIFWESASASLLRLEISRSSFIEPCSYRPKQTTTKGQTPHDLTKSSLRILGRRPYNAHLLHVLALAVGVGDFAGFSLKKYH